MKYAQIREMDISNGEGIGIALFVQGCSFHCYNCFNPETWDFSSGKEWTPEVENEFIKLAKRPYIKRVSILGGEPLVEKNLDGVLNLVNKIGLLLPEKTIWIYSGFAWDEIFTEQVADKEQAKRREIISKCDVWVDGRYIDSQKDISLKWRGSKNQRVINIEESLKKGEVVLWCV